MEKRYGKLVRDRIPEILDAAGLRYEVRTLSSEGYRAALRAKIREEAAELAEAPPGELVKEIGDLLEVLDALMEAEGLERGEVEALRRDRRRERGGFEVQLELVWVEER